MNDYTDFTDVQFKVAEAAYLWHTYGLEAEILMPTEASFLVLGVL